MQLSAFEDHFGTNACLKSLGDSAHLQILVWRMWQVECRVQLRHSCWVCGPRLVQVRGHVPGAARPEGLQQGRGAVVEGHGGPCARQPQGVSHGQGPA